jgi:NAD dependent epimerase/dehydratase family enzyme
LDFSLVRPVGIRCGLTTRVFGERIAQTENAQGAYNLIAPTPTANAEFNRTLAEAIHRPYWFPIPAFLLRTLLGEMSVLILEGRFSKPKRLTESGYRFQFPGPREALADLLG